MSDSAALCEAIRERLSGVVDPETGVDVMRMRLIEDLTVADSGVASYTFRPSSPLCPLAVALALSIREAVAVDEAELKKSLAAAAAKWENALCSPTALANLRIHAAILHAANKLDRYLLLRITYRLGRRALGRLKRKKAPP